MVSPVKLSGNVERKHQTINRSDGAISPIALSKREELKGDRTKLAVTGVLLRLSNAR